ncbi:MAG: hypothetical protein ACI82F_000584 [Planctomycetota bacterium]|jgi:hypothetical protein
MLLGLSTVLCAFPLLSGDATTEPPLTYTLEIDGKPFELVGGEPTEIKIKGKKHVVSVVPGATRLLELPGLEFEYPAGMTFSYLDMDSMQSWRLTSDESTVLLYRFESVSAAEMISGMITGFEAAMQKTDFGPKKVQLKNGREIFKGTAERFLQNGLTLQLEFYPIKLEGGTECLLILQGPIEDGDLSQALGNLRGVLEESLAPTE